MQGSAKLRENLKPNEKPVEVEEKVQDNIRQVKTVAGKKYYYLKDKHLSLLVYLLRCYDGGSIIAKKKSNMVVVVFAVRHGLSSERCCSGCSIGHDS